MRGDKPESGTVKKTKNRLDIHLSDLNIKVSIEAVCPSRELNRDCRSL